jgi:hypothetical protein
MTPTSIFGFSSRLFIAGGVLMVALSPLLAACAAAGDPPGTEAETLDASVMTDAGSTYTPPDYAEPDPDAGLRSGGGSSGGDAGPGGSLTLPGLGDGGLTLPSLPSLPNLFDDGGLFSGGGSRDASADGGAACKDALCFDVFDCWIYHGGCGFTACEGLICK